MLKINISVQYTPLYTFNPRVCARFGLAKNTYLIITYLVGKNGKINDIDNSNKRYGQNLEDRQKTEFWDFQNICDFISNADLMK